MAACCFECVLRVVTTSRVKSSRLSDGSVNSVVLPVSVVALCLSHLSVSNAAACDAASRAWRETCEDTWRERCAYLTGQPPQPCDIPPKRAYVNAAASAQHGLAFTHGHGFLVAGTVGLRLGAAGASVVRPASDAAWVATIGAPTRGRRFVAVRVRFAWSWCCHVGVLEVSDTAFAQRIDLDSLELWRVTARPPSRYEEGSLAIEIADGQGIDVGLRPWTGSPFVRHDAENSREATVGILIDAGRVTFFMQSARGRWANTGVVAEREGAFLVPFVANPLQQAEVLNTILPPEIPSLRREEVITLTSSISKAEPQYKAD